MLTVLGFSSLRASYDFEAWLAQLALLFSITSSFSFPLACFSTPSSRLHSATQCYRSIYNETIMFYGQAASTKFRLKEAY